MMIVSFIMYQNFITVHTFTICTSVIEIAIPESSYFVPESGSSVMVCARIFRGSTAIPVSATLSATQIGSATGN